MTNFEKWVKSRHKESLANVLGEYIDWDCRLCPARNGCRVYHGQVEYVCDEELQNWCVSDADN